MQEIGASTATLLTGLGIDEYLTRTDTTGTRTLLTDSWVPEAVHNDCFNGHR